jgi:hypothetical protein
MTPLGLMGLLLAAYALIRRWERLQRREAGSEREQDRQPEPETAVRRPWWKRWIG